MSDQRPQCGVVDTFYDVDHSESDFAYLNLTELARFLALELGGDA